MDASFETSSSRNESYSSPTSKGRIAICVPCNWEWLRKDFVSSLVALRAPGYECRIIFLEAHELYQMRNLAVERAKEIHADWLLFIDADMTFAPDALERLLSREVAVVSALYRQRRAPFGIVAWTTAGLEDGQMGYRQVIPTDCPSGEWGTCVEATGCGFLLIHVKVFDSISKRFPGANYFEWSNAGSEDAHFCDLARRSGYNVMLDWTTAVGHLITAEVVQDPSGTPGIRILNGA